MGPKNAGRRCVQLFVLEFFVSELVLSGVEGSGKKAEGNYSLKNNTKNN
jgi:hypothetical protein